MAMKRSLSYDSLVSDTNTPSPTPSSPLDQFSPDKIPDISQSVASSEPKGKRAKKATKESKGPKPKVKKATSGGDANFNSNGVWDGEKRSLFLDEIIAAGYRSVDLDSLAARLGLSKRQLIDQLVPNRSNLRGKVVKTAKEW